MSFFLLTVTSRTGVRPDIERFEDGQVAMAAFERAEREIRDSGSDNRVVLLIAKDEDTLRRTHSHYFATVEELLAEARG